MEKNISDWLGDPDIVGRNLIHDKFGSGVITEFNGKSIIKVSFSNGESKLFYFPMAFDHMRFEDDKTEEAFVLKLADRKR